MACRYRMEKYKLTRIEVEEIMDYQKTESVKKMIIFTRPNYYTFCLKQDKHMLDKVYDQLKWELQSYPLRQHHHFYNYIGVYFAIRGYAAKATEYLLEAVRLKPQSEVGLANLIILLCDSDRRDQAAIYIKRLTELKKNQMEVNLDLGLLFQLFNLNVAARQLYEKYLDNIHMFNDFVMFQYGRVIFAHCTGKIYYDDNIDKAIKIFVEVNRRDPQFLPVYLSLVTSLNLKWSQSQKSSKNHPHVDVLVKKIRKASYVNNSHGLYLIGKLLMKLRKFEEAKEFLEKSVNNFPTVENHHQLGKCMLKLSHLLPALTHLKEAQRLSKVFCVKVTLKQAAALVGLGRRIEALRLVNGVSEDYVTRHDKAALELFSAEQNIVVVPEVTEALDKTLKLLHKSYSRKIYHRFIKVVKLFIGHLSNYYTTTGLPQSQSEMFLKWVKFLQEKGEISEEKIVHLTKIQEVSKNLIPGRRTSTVNRRRSSMRSISGYAPLPSTPQPDSATPIINTYSSTPLPPSPQIAQVTSTDSTPLEPVHIVTDSLESKESTLSNARSRRRSVLGGLRPMDSKPAKRNSFVMPVIEDQIYEED